MQISQKAMYQKIQKIHVPCTGILFEKNLFDNNYGDAKISHTQVIIS